MINKKSKPLYKFAIVISESDNVAVAKKEIKKGTFLKYKDCEINIFQDILQGQRFALKDINKGEHCNQFGYSFGISKGIRIGEIISVFNVRNYKVDYRSAISKIHEYKKNNSYKKKDISKTFLGHKRTKGLVGTRNYYLLLPTSMCASDVATKIAYELDNDKTIKKKYRNIDGFVVAAHTEGCGCNDGNIIDRLLLMLKNTIIHPNVGGALVIDLGCEKTNRKIVARYLNGLFPYRKVVDFLTIQDSGGTSKSISKGKEIILSRIKSVNAVKREVFPLKHLTVGTECGASDSFSGITANPLIGKVVDAVVIAGGSGILSETPEMIGAEMNLIERMVSKKVVQKFIHGMEYYNKLAQQLGVSMAGNLVDRNKKEGLINVAIKSLGAILKGGSSAVVDFVDYAEQIKKNGLNIMNGPGNDLESMTGIMASGANIILFSTGAGTTEGNIIVPVIKIPTRTEIFKKLKDDMDFDAGRLLGENISLDELSEQLLDLVVKVASGKKTRSEILKKRSFQIWTAGKLSL